MFHSAAFAIAAGVVGVAAAGTSAALSMSAANRAAKAQGAAAAKFEGAQGKAMRPYIQGQKEVKDMIQNVGTPTYDLNAMIGDASRISEYNRQQAELFQPGAAAIRSRSAGQINQAMDVINSYLQGEIPQDVKDQILRNVAQSAGAGFNPATAGRAGGFQAAQGVMARQLGLTSLDLQGRGLSALPSIQGVAQNWQQLARSFTADPLDVGRMQLAFQSAATETGLQKAKMTSDIYGNIYNAQTGAAANIYGANKETIGANLAANQALASGIGSIGQAASGTLGGISQARGMQQLAQGMGGYGGLNTATGFYGNQASAAQAYGVPASQIAYYNPKGGGGGFYLGG